MTSPPASPEEPSDPGNDPLTRGLAAGFGPHKGDGLPTTSVLEALSRRGASGIAVHLPEPSGGERPVLKVTSELASRTAGRYQVLGEIARGGVGVVFHGHDVDLGRDVAIKVLHERFLDRPDVLGRFVEEAQIGGQLQHPGIVPVYELGLQHGKLPFFAMKLIQGSTLAALLGQRRRPDDDRRRFLGIFEQVCQTVAYAHARGVVHRDLKPANVMVGAFGEVQVVDWGFAKVLRSGGVADEAAAAPSPSTVATVRSRRGSGTSSVAGSVLGTPAYMPPEQARGDLASLDERGDVFSLGAILCEILTGKPPYLEVDGPLLAQASEARLDPAGERLRASGADAELIELARQCLDPVARDRPATAREVAERLARYLSAVEERAQAARIGAAEARVRARSAVMLSAAAVLLVVLAGGTWIWQERQAQARRTQATQMVTDALREATECRARAQATSANVQLWEQALAAARRAEGHARTDDVAPEQRTRAETLRTTIEEEQARAQATTAQRARDTAMREALLRLQIPTDDDAYSPAWALAEARRLLAAYADAFRTYMEGGDLLAATVDGATASLGRGGMAVELAAALDHWSLARQDLAGESDAPDAAATARLRAVADRLDPDPWRQGLRRLLGEPKAHREALETLARSADHATLPALTPVLLGQALWRAGAEDAAVTAYRAAHECHPGDFALCFGLALRLGQLDPPRWNESVELLRAARALQPHLREVQHRLGQALLRARRLDEALVVFAGLVRAEPDSAHFHHDLAAVHRAQGRMEEALTLLRRAVAIDPRSATARYWLAEALKDDGQADEAIDHYREALISEPRKARVHVGLAGALGDQGKIDEAIACLRQALSLDADHAIAHTELGRWLKERGKLDEALVHCRRALDLHLKDPAAFVNLGNVLAAMGQETEASRYYREALRLDPECASAHGSLGLQLARLGTPGDAIIHLRKAAALEPNNPVAHNGLGGVLWEQGKVDDAVLCYRRAVELNACFVMALQNLGMALTRQGKLDEAVTHLERAIELDPGIAMVHVNLALALKAQGKEEDATARLHEALRRDPRCFPAHVNLGLWLSQQGSPLQALHHNRRAVAILSTEHGAFAANWRQQVAARVAALEASLDRDLLEILRGKRRATSATEWAEAALAAWRKQAFLACAVTFEQAFAAHPDLAQDVELGHRYRAVRAAALAAAGKGQGLERADDAERARLRALALAWLQADLAFWQGEIALGNAARSRAGERLRLWQADANLATLRDAAALEALPAEEARAWRELWLEVQRLREAALR